MYSLDFDIDFVWHLSIKIHVNDNGQHLKIACLFVTTALEKKQQELTYHIYNIFVSSFAISKNAIKLVKATRGSLQGRGVM